MKGKQFNVCPLSQIWKGLPRYVCGGTTVDSSELQEAGIKAES